MMRMVLMTALAAVLFAAPAQATVIARWTFETSPPADLSNSATGPTVSADEGTGSMNGVHASAATDWSTPSGNGSANSYSSNTWAVGDYNQFVVATTGATAIQVSWDQTRSATGPVTFDLEYSTDGSTFLTALNDYTVAENANPPGFWGATPVSGYSFMVNLSGVSTSVENQSTLFLRLTNQAAPGGTGGTNRVDNFLVEGTFSAVPEPSSFALVGLCVIGGAVAVRRNRRAKLEISPSE